MSGEPNTALDQLEAELFRAARRELEPDQARVDSLWQSVAAASTLGAAISGVSWAAPLPSAAPAPTIPTPAPTTSSGLSRTGKTSFGLRALFGATVGGALLGFAAGYGAGGAQHAIDPPGPAAMVSAKASTATAVEAADANPGAASQQQASEPEAPAALPEISAKPRALGSSNANSSDAGSSDAGSSKPAAESAKPSFYEELQYLKRAQSALRQGNGALALGLMTELDSIQSGGALLSERGVTQVLAHCQLGDIQSATRVARRLAARGLASVYAERLEKSCAGAVLPKP